MITAEGSKYILNTKAYKNLSKTNNELYGYSPDNDINEFVSELSKYINITNYYKGFQNLYDGVYMKWLDGVVNDDYGDGNYEEFMVVTTQKGYVYGITIPDSYDGVIQQFTEDEILEAGGSLITRAGEIVIDVNGKANPNTYGRDIFRFFLGSDGMLYPQGGLDYSIYLSGDDSRTWENSDSNYDQCINISTSKGNGCTARLIENNFKFDY